MIRKKRPILIRENLSMSIICLQFIAQLRSNIKVRTLLLIKKDKKKFRPLMKTK